MDFHSIGTVSNSWAFEHRTPTFWTKFCDQTKSIFRRVVKWKTTGPDENNLHKQYKNAKKKKKFFFIPFFFNLKYLLWNESLSSRACARHRQDTKAACNSESWSRWKICKKRETIGKKLNDWQWPPSRCYRMLHEFYWLFVARELLHRHDHRPLAIGMWKRRDLSEMKSSIALQMAKTLTARSCLGISTEMKTLSAANRPMCSLELRYFSSPNKLNRTNGNRRKKIEKNK